MESDVRHRPLLRAGEGSEEEGKRHPVVGWLVSTSPKARVEHGSRVGGANLVLILAFLAFALYSLVELAYGYNDYDFATSFTAEESLPFPAFSVKFLNYSSQDQPLDPGVRVIFSKMGLSSSECAETAEGVVIGNETFFFGNVDRSCHQEKDGVGYQVVVFNCPCDTRHSTQAIVNIGFRDASEYSATTASRLSDPSRASANAFTPEVTITAPAVLGVNDFYMLAKDASLISKDRHITYGTVDQAGSFALSQCEDSGRANSIMHFWYRSLTVEHAREFRKRDFGFLVAAIGGALSLQKVAFAVVSFFADRGGNKTL